jgi:hypothetical protein
MATNMTKGARRTVRRRAVTQQISDRRYYIQCGYRLSMAIISLIALFVVTHH